MGVMDAGEPGCRFRCRRCGHETDWIGVWSVKDGWERTDQPLTLTEAKRGVPCPKCNQANP